MCSTIYKAQGVGHSQTNKQTRAATHHLYCRVGVCLIRYKLDTLPAILQITKIKVAWEGKTSNSFLQILLFISCTFCFFIVFNSCVFICMYSIIFKNMVNACLCRITLHSLILYVEEFLKSFLRRLYHFCLVIEDRIKYTRLRVIMCMD